MIPSLEAAYAEPHRRYHTRAHIESCLAELSKLHGLSAEDRRTLEYAIWWHDAVYDPHRPDNEARSADLAREDLTRLGVPERITVEVARLILLTKGHEVAPGDVLGALLVSIDLSILGAPEAEYDDYAKAIREEYGFVSDDAFRNGRAAILRRFLESPAVFPDAGFRARLEASARANLAREIAALTS
jgi:predicted metal-dependent HD superfamily phosphohydrolase